MTGVWTVADWRVHFDERAAILEHDAGLPRTEAEKHALVEVYDQLAARGPLSAGILGELIRASHWRFHPELAPAFKGLAVAHVRTPLWVWIVSWQKTALIGQHLKGSQARSLSSRQPLRTAT